MEYILILRNTLRFILLLNLSLDCSDLYIILKMIVAATKVFSIE